MTKVPPNVRNVQSNVILILPNVTMVPSNVRKRERERERERERITKCDKSTVTFDVGTI